MLTGEHDENRDNTQRVSVSGFKREGFRNVLFLEVPAMNHSLPPAANFGAALDFLADLPQKAGPAGSQL